MADLSAIHEAVTVDQPLQAILDEEGPEALIDAVLTARNETEQSDLDRLKAAAREYFVAAEECERAVRCLGPVPDPNYASAAARSRAAREALRSMVEGPAVRVSTGGRD